MDYKNVYIKLVPNPDGDYKINFNGKEIVVQNHTIHLFIKDENLKITGLDGTTFKSVEIKND